MENKQKTPRKKLTHMMALATVWGTVFILLVIAFVIMNFAVDMPSDNIYSMLSIITAFSAFVVQTLFTFTIIRHNEILRDSTNEINARAESTRTLQFISTNYTIVDFVDHMFLFDEPERYRKALKKTQILTLYLKEEGITNEDVFENFDQYDFVTMKIPIQMVEGKTVGKLRITKLKFTKEEAEYRFVTCCSNNESLVLFNEDEKRSEVSVNLIIKKDSGFYPFSQASSFSKLRIFFTVQSLLGVLVTGTVQLYFSNQQIREAGTISKFRINSSHFEIAGLPTLRSPVESDLKSN